jgi:glycosyltransferase involved in cell wall biosynthesis
MTDNFQFDVVIPAFNASDFLEETLNSISGQSLPPQSVIVVDDGSTDTTVQIARKFSPLVTCISIANGGQGLARMLAIQYCKSSWIALCDSDDLWNEDHLLRRAGLISTFPDAEFTYSDCFSFGPGSQDNHLLSSEAPEGWHEQWESGHQNNFFHLNDPYRAFLKFNPAYLSGVAFKRDAYVRMGGFLPKYSRWIGEDTEFVRRFLLQSGIVVAGDSLATWGYRRHANNYSKDQWKNIHGKARILQEHLNLGLVPTEYKADQLFEIHRSWRRAFDHACWGGDHIGAVTLFKQMPSEIKSVKSYLKYLRALIHTAL